MQMISIRNVRLGNREQLFQWLTLSQGKYEESGDKQYVG